MQGLWPERGLRRVTYGFARYSHGIEFGLVRRARLGAVIRDEDELFPLGHARGQRVSIHTRILAHHSPGLSST